VSPPGAPRSAHEPLDDCQYNKWSATIALVAAHRDAPKIADFRCGVSEQFLRMVDDWRRGQTDLPSRAEAIRRLVELATKINKVADHHGAGAKYIVSADMSCLMHQKGCAERLGLDIRFIHIAQILNGDRAFIAAKAHQEFHDRRLWDLGLKRDREAHGIPEWEDLRRLASQIKEHTLSRLADVRSTREGERRPGALGLWGIACSLSSAPVAGDQMLRKIGETAFRAR
jgi:hypothetical protein